MAMSKLHVIDRHIQILHAKLVVKCLWMNWILTRLFRGSLSGICQHIKFYLIYITISKSSIIAACIRLGEMPIENCI